MTKSRISLILAAALLLAATRCLGQAEPKFEIQRARYEAVDGTGGADVTQAVKAMIKDGRLSLVASNKDLGGDAAPGHVKQLRVEYTLDGKPLVAIAKENQPLEIPPVAPLTPQQRKERAVAALKSDASFEKKCDACRELAILGDKEVIPTLAGLLADEKLSHMARYALEPNPDPAVDDVFREALGQVKGRLLAGVIHSIGMRKDVKAVEPLAKLLGDADSDVAQAAARALGRIGGPDAAKALNDALAGAPAANQIAFCEGLLHCAEGLAADGKRDEALAIYDRLRALQGPHQVRTAGLRGAVLTRGKEGVPMLMEAIRGNDFALAEAAARTAMEMPGPEVTQALADELGKLPADKQVLVALTLGKRADAAALPALFALAKSGDKAARVAAIRSLPEIGSATAAPVLVELLGDAEPDIAQAAQEGLAALPGPEVDEAVAAMLKRPEAKTRCTGIELIGRRRAAGALPTLLKAAEDADEEVRIAGLKVLSDMAGAAELSAMLDILSKAKSPQEAQAAESALSALCARQADAEACADKILAALAQAQGVQKLALLAVLRSVGGAKALAAARTAASDANAEVKDAALRTLCDWPTVDALPDVTQLAKTSADPKLKIIALRGYIRLIPLQETPDEQKLASLKEAMALAERNEEKKLALSALGGIPIADALALVAPHLGNSALKEEAGLAAVAIAEKIVQTHPAQVAEAMQQVSTANAKIAKRAKDLLGQAKAAASKREGK